MCEGHDAAWHLLSPCIRQELGPWNKPVDQKGSTRHLGSQQPDPLKANSPELLGQAWDRARPDFEGIRQPWLWGRNARGRELSRPSNQQS